MNVYTKGREETKTKSVSFNIALLISTHRYLITPLQKRLTTATTLMASTTFRE